MESRKRRRGWVVALGAGLCSSLVPACTTTTRQSTLAAQDATRPTAAAGSKDSNQAGGVATATAPRSDYAIVPSPTATAETAAKPQNTAALVPAGGAAATTAEPTTSAELSPPLAPVGTASSDGSTRPVRRNASRLMPDIEKTQARQVLAIETVKDMAPPRHEGCEPSEARKPEPPILSALRCFLDNRHAEALGHLKQYEDKTNQELLVGLVAMLAQLSEDKTMTSREAAVMVDQLESLMMPLRSRAPLLIEEMCFCESIDAFGVYKQLPEEHVFQAGELVRVYVELRNFSSERMVRDGRPIFATPLASAVEIRDAFGKSVFKQELHRERPDLSQTPRHDYFDHYRFYLPELRSGWYKLEINVEDLVTHRRAKRSLDLKVGVQALGS